MKHRVRVLALSLAAMSAAGILLSASAPAQQPRIGKPRPAPPTRPSLPPLPPAALDNSLSIGGDDVNARKLESRMTVEVHVNGYGPYRFVVDSGADTSVVGLRIAQALKLPLGAPALLNSMTSRNVVDRVNVDSLTVGPSTIKTLALPALAEENLGAHGLLGIDSLVRKRLMMDFEKRVIKVEDARRPPKFEPGAIVITAQRRRGQLILTHVRAGGVGLDAVIDTGSEVTIGNSALRNKLLRRWPGDVEYIEITGVTGKTLKVPAIVVDELSLGPIQLTNVPIAFADLPPFALFGLADEPALLIGTDLLENFRRVSLDFHARKVRFQLKRCAPRGVILRATSSHTASILSAHDPLACGD